MKLIRLANILLLIILCLILPYFYLYIIFLLLHECGHLVASYLLGYKTKINFLIPIGINIKVSQSLIPPIDDIIISSSGPMINLVLFVVFKIISSFNPHFIEASNINLVLFLFNALPVMSFDGGRILKAIAFMKLNMYYGIILSNINSLILSFIMFFFSYRSIASINKLLYSILGIFLIINSIDALKKLSFEILQNILLKEKAFEKNKKLKLEGLVYDKKTKILDIIKKFCFNKYYIIYIMNKGCLSLKVTETALIQQFLAHGNIRLENCIFLTGDDNGG